MLNFCLPLLEFLM